MNKSAKIAIAVHPHAEVYRMHTGEELDLLVDSIRRNGLRDPITLDRKGQIIDGRNRETACEIAGVEPRFETFEGDDEAIAELIHDRNSARRDLTTGQKALAYALLFPEQEQGKRTDLSGSGQVGPDRQRVMEARLVLKHSAPDEIEAVKVGTTKLNAAYERAQQRRRETEAAKDEGRRLAAVAEIRKDLADLVQKGTIGLAAAEAQIREDEEKVLAERQRLTGYVASALKHLQMPPGMTPQKWAADLYPNLDAEYFPATPHCHLDAPSIRTAAAMLSALADEFDGDETP